MKSILSVVLAAPISYEVTRKKGFPLNDTSRQSS
jgi:hypothetical protein